MILDEASASIDSVTDKLIQQAMVKQFAGRSVFSIAHCIDSIVDADSIISVKDGKV
jgi:ATP-binding cassette subfamily B protein